MNSLKFTKVNGHKRAKLRFLKFIGDSAPSRPLIPIELGHPIRLKSATYSD